MVNITIIDGYIDEPTCLGVPPYISPYPRYLAGSIWHTDRSAVVKYFTIEQIRNNQSIASFIAKSDLLFVIAGMAVPGRYLSGYPASPNEISEIFKKYSKPIKFLCGPAARYGFGLSGGKKPGYLEINPDLQISGDVEVIIPDILKNIRNFWKVDSSKKRENAHQISNFAMLGARIIIQHPNFPDFLIAEIETYRGCPRSIIGGCSFCSEPQKGLPDFRPIKDIINEIESLYKHGLRNFRIGNQPCIFSYLAKDSGKVEFPRPDPDVIETLFSGIRKVAPDLKTLHIDNANPGVIAKFPQECRKIAKSIIKYHTPGDVAAFGVESVDPVVIKQNNLKANSEEVFSAIRLINKVGSNKGYNGMPELLPGLNFVFGLKGETKETFKQDMIFLKKIFDENLFLRRINLRQLIPIPGTKISKIGNKIVNKHKVIFKKFKNQVKTDIERPMLKRLLPRGTLLRDVYAEKTVGKTTFGRQLGSYPLLIGIPGIIKLNQFIDVKVIDYGFRSITAISYPLEINSASREMIEAIPGIGKKRAIRILAKRPFKSIKDLSKSLDDETVAKEIMNFLTFSK